MLNLENMTADQILIFNSIPSKIHNEFNKLTEDILKSTPLRIVDLLSLVVSRHPYQSPLFDICIKLEMVNLYLDKCDVHKKIITSDMELYKILNSSNIDCELEFRSVNKIPNIFFDVFNFVKKLSKVILIIFQELKSRDKSRVTHLQSLNTVTLIDTFMLKNSIAKKKYVDRYYNGLLDFLEKKSRKNIFFLPQINANYSRKDLKYIQINSDENIVYKHDFLKIVDYAIAFLQLSKHKVYKHSNYYFKDYNITRLVYKQIRFNKFNSSTFSALINYYFIKRLKQCNINLGLFINWNENQPIDKGFIRGLHDFYPDIVVKGYRAFIVSTDYNLYLSPTQNEVDNKVIPDEIIVTGNGLVNQARNFCDNVKVSVGPAFRFQDIHKSTILLRNNNTILVALPIGLKESINLIKDINTNQNEENISKFNYIIRPHPATSLEKLKDKTKYFWKMNYTWSIGSFKENILKSFLLISHTSSVLLESLAYGVPVIILGSNNSITQNPIPKNIDNKLWSIVFDSKNLFNEILKFYHGKEFYYQDLILSSKLIKQNYFGETTKYQVDKLFKI